MTEQKKSSARKYVVLKKVHLHDGWKWDDAATIEASSANQAIRLVASEKGEGTYVAVPEGNWTEITARVEVPAPRVVLSGEDGGEDRVEVDAIVAGQTSLT